MISVVYFFTLLGVCLCGPQQYQSQYRGRPLLGNIIPTQIPPGNHVEDNFESQRSYTGQQSYRSETAATQGQQNYRSESTPSQGQNYEAQKSYRGQQNYQTQGYKTQNYQSQTPSYSQEQYTTPYRVNQPKEVIPILAYSNDVAFDGSYNFNYETADGQSRQETGVMTNPGTEDEAQSVTGSYSYTAPDGTLITVTYIADANGFRAEGAHLPTPPPIPAEIAKSLEYIARLRSSQPAGYEEDDGQYRRTEQPYQKNRYNL